MKAIQIIEFGGPDVMKLVELPDPTPGEGEVLLDVTAIGINYADTHQTENSYLSPQALPLIPGIEVVGKYEGKRYLASVSSGGYAEKAVAHKAVMFPIPDGVTDEQAVCMLVQGTTAWHLLKTMGHVKPGESVVVHAAGIGRFDGDGLLIFRHCEPRSWVLRRSNLLNDAGIASGNERPRNDIPIIGVPGYPVSAALTIDIFVEPLIAQWLGRRPLHRLSSRRSTNLCWLRKKP